jgi:hypothetical protein
LRSPRDTREIEAAEHVVIGSSAQPSESDGAISYADLNKLLQLQANLRCGRVSS